MIMIKVVHSLKCLLSHFLVYFVRVFIVLFIIEINVLKCSNVANDKYLSTSVVDQIGVFIADILPQARVQNAFLDDKCDFVSRRREAYSMQRHFIL